MHISLTDALACPRCGPEWGLILIAKRTVERRVLDGYFGCANCRQEWLLKDGYAEFIEGEASDVDLQAPSSESAMLMGAALGVTEGPGAVLLVGSGAGSGHLLAQMIEGIEVICVARGLSGEAEVPGVSRLGAGERLPFRNGFARGVVLTDEPSQRYIEQAADIIGVAARIAVLSGAAEVSTRMESSGLRVLLREANVTVAQRAAL